MAKPVKKQSKKRFRDRRDKLPVNSILDLIQYHVIAGGVARWRASNDRKMKAKFSNELSGKSAVFTYLEDATNAAVEEAKVHYRAAWDLIRVSGEDYSLLRHGIYRSYLKEAA